MAIRNVTSADAKLYMTAAGLFPAPTQIYDFSTDTMFGSDAVDNSEDYMGADGEYSAGWIPQIKTWTVTLQAGSPSHKFFQSIYQAEESVRSKITIGATLYLPSAGTVYTFSTGILKNLKILPDAGKVLQAQSYQTRWKSITPSPI